jgi:hypothetical protein
VAERRLSARAFIDGAQDMAGAVVTGPPASRPSCTTVISQIEQR